MVAITVVSGTVHGSLIVHKNLCQQLITSPVVEFESLVTDILFIYFIMSPTKGERGHISFSVDPVCRRQRDKFVSTIFLESVGGILPDLHGYIIGTSQRAD